MSSPVDEPRGEPAASHRAVGWLIVGLALLVGWTFRGTVGAGFVDYDDDLYVTAAPWTDEGLSADGFVAAFDRFYASNWHPLTVLSHQLDVELFGLDARGHHVVNVLWHAANAVLLFVLFRAMTGSLWKSVLVAALFAVHPLRVESVAWVSERKDVLSTFLALLTIAVYVRYARRPSVGGYLAVAGLFSAALMAKAMVVTLPCVLLLLDAWPLRRLGEPRVGRTLAVRIVEKMPLLALSAAVSWATVAAQGQAMDASGGVSLGLRLANAVTATGDYLANTLWPTGLAVFYPFPESIPTWRIVVAGLVLGALTVAAFVGHRRTPWWTVGWLWFLGTLVPVIGLLRVGEQAMADRYTYLPSIGLLWALVWAAGWGIERLAGERRVPVAIVGSILAIGALSVTTHRQVGHWQSSEALWTRALAVTESNDLAHLNLAEVLRAERRLDEAIEHYRAALGIRPDLALAHAGLGQALRADGQIEAALEHFETAAQLDPSDPRFRHIWGMGLVAAGREAEGESILRAVVEERPEMVGAHLSLGDLLARRGDLAAATEHYRAASRAAPGALQIRARLAGLLERQDRLDEAAAEWQALLAMAPGAIEAHRALGEIRRRQGDLVAARDHLGTAFAASRSPEIAAQLVEVLLALGDQQTADQVRAVAGLDREPGSASISP